MRRVIAVILFGLAAACSDAPSSNHAAQQPASAPPVASASKPGTADAVPLPARDSSGVPAEFRDLWKQAASGGTKGEHVGITYQYAVSGDRAVAVMIPRPIRRDDTMLVGTISDLARRALKVDLSKATPRLEPTKHGGNAIAFTVGRQTYYVLTIKNETQEGAYGPGEPHTLLIWREGK